MGSVGNAIVQVATGGLYSPNKGFTTPFSKDWMRAPGEAAKGLFGTTGGRLATDFLTGGTGGIFDFEKGRVNVPFSSAQVRAGGRSSISALSLGLARKAGSKAIESPTSKAITPYVGAVGAAATGYGAASALGASSGTAALVGGAASQAALKLNSTASPSATPDLLAPPIPKQNSVEDARKAARQRRRDYQDLGRSSTILTGPSGLGGMGPGGQKTLLGY